MTARYVAYLVSLIGLLAVMGCHPVAEPRNSVPNPVIVPDTIHTLMRALPVVVADTIPNAPGTGPGVTIGRFTFQEGRILIWRGIFDPAMRLKIIYHEQCHAILIETGLWNQLNGDVIELVCDAFARERVAAAIRGSP